MKKTSKENIAISETISKALGITFINEEFSLGKWGEVDNWCELSNDTIVLLECEKGQKHPNTNILKLYPWLEEFPKVHVILLHYFFPENKAPKNRVALCSYIGEKMENNFGIRFQYVHLKCEGKMIASELKKHNKRLMQVLLTGKVRLKINNERN
jgi:hypothetical protein